MTGKLMVGNFQGLATDKIPPFIDNSTFPTLQNAYAWRGRAKKKRGTELLNRLQRKFSSGSNTITLDGSGNGNILSGFMLQANASIVPGSVTIVDTIATVTYTDPAKNGTLSPSGSINYATGSIIILAAAGHTITASFQYYPTLPVMGLEDFLPTPTNATPISYPLLVAFDTTYSYQLLPSSKVFYDVTFYKNPINPSTNLPWKTTNTPFVWSGDDWQQFWTTMYFNAMWATNGKPGFHYVNGAYVSGSGTPNIVFNFTFPAGGPYQSLVVGDVLWFNEWGTNSINGLTGIVTVVNNAGTGQYTVTFTGNQTASGIGIAQLLTNSIPGQDGIKWYDGDPTIPNGPNGWVNFSPPLSKYDSSTNKNPFYLIGCTSIVAFKDRLLAFGATVANTTGAASVMYQYDTVVYSQVGSPFYVPNGPDATGANPPTGGGTSMVPLGITPPSTTSLPVTAGNAWWSFPPGFGGFESTGLDMAITTVNPNEDVLIVGLSNNRFVRLVYTANDLRPFIFYSINSELGANATFSGISLDRGVVSLGQYAISLTDQTSSRRIDLIIPDNIFQVAQDNHGAQRVNAVRDFRNEWMFFTYPKSADPNIFPTQSFFFNYRDNTWAIFDECFTTQGQVRLIYTSGLGRPWEELTDFTWAEWLDPWNSGFETEEFPNIIGGNQQGFVLIKETDDIGEGQALAIQSIAISGSSILITSPNHCLTPNDYILIQGCLGVANINNTIRQVTINDIDSFYVDTFAGIPTGTYLGLGTYCRLPVFNIQTKQFPIFWEQGRKVRIGTQLFLFDTTNSGQITLNMFQGQNPVGIVNPPPYYPDPNSSNDAIIYTNILYTSPEQLTTTINSAGIGTIGNAVLTTITINLFQLLNIISGGVPDGGTSIQPGSVMLVIGNPMAARFTDNGDGTFTAQGTGISLGSTINYNTGITTLVFSTAPNQQFSFASFSYFYNLSQTAPQTQQDQIWHRMNTSILGDSVQLGFTMSDAQMRNLTLVNQDFVMHAFVVEFSPAGVLAGLW